MSPQVSKSHSKHHTLNSMAAIWHLHKLWIFHTIWQHYTLQQMCVFIAEAVKLGVTANMDWSRILQCTIMHGHSSDVHCSSIRVNVYHNIFFRNSCFLISEPTALTARTYCALFSPTKFLRRTQFTPKNWASTASDKFLVELSILTDPLLVIQCQVLGDNAKERLAKWRCPQRSYWRLCMYLNRQMGR
jgi:hypothetical protein